MNCYLMAAGNGMRLSPITDNFQKCLLPVHGKPILEWWLDAVFKSNCFDKVFVNVHKCADEVEKWLTGYTLRSGYIVRTIDERTKLLGTAGTLYWYLDDSDFMVAYTDTYCEDFYTYIEQSVSAFEDLPKKILVGLVSFDSPEDGSAGMIITDSLGNIVEFRDKSDIGSVAWAGILFGKNKFLLQIKEEDVDLARDVLPRLCGRMRILSHTKAYDIGRGIEHYEKLSGKATGN